MKQTRWSAILAFCASLVLLIGGCAPATTPTADDAIQAAASPRSETTPEAGGPLPTAIPLTVAEAEKAAGFDVKEPAYLPAGVSFDFAVYQGEPSPAVTQYFRFRHEQYGDMGVFFQIVQEPQADASAAVCGGNEDGCETLQAGDVLFVYRLNAAGTEGLEWHADGFSFRLLRTAGEPNKIYKDELIKVAGSMK